MGRYTSNGSSGSSGTSVTPAITTTVVAGEAISAGDLVTLSEDNLAYYAVEQRGAGALLRPVYRPTSASNVAVAPVTSAGAVSSSYNYNNIGQAVLSNGNVVLTWVDGNAPYNARFAIYNNLGQLQGAIGTLGSAYSSANDIAVAAIPTGGFVVAYCSATDPKFVVLNNQGAIVVGQTSVQSTGNNSRSVGVVVLPNNNIVITYLIQNPTYWAPNYAVFSIAGAVVKAATSLSAPTTQSGSAHAVDVCALSGGGFVVSYYLPTGIVNCRRVDNTGNFQGAEIAALSGLGGINGYSYVKSLNTGGFVVGAFAPNTTYKASVYDGSGVLQGSQILLDSMASSNGWTFAIVNFSSGNWAAIWISQGVLKAQSFSASGVSIVGPVTLPITPYQFSAISAAVSANDELTIGYGSNSSNLSLVVTDSALNVKSMASTSDFGSSVTIYNILMSYFPVSVFSSPINTLFVTTNGFAGVRTGYIPSCIPLGVAIASAPKGGSVPVQITGNTTLRTGFNQPFFIDTNGNLPPGQRMSIIGNQVILQGIQGAQHRSIN